MNSDTGRNAVMVVCLSRFNPKNEDKDDAYEFDYEGEVCTFKGKQTNDAPTRCLIKCAEEDGNKINKILCIVTKEVFQSNIAADNDENGCEQTTAYRRYVKLVKSIDNDIDVIPIYDGFSVVDGNIEDGNGTDEKAMIVYKMITEELMSTDYRNSYAYIDYTGGLRDMSFLMTSIIRYMEFYGIKLRRIVYSDYFRSTKKLVSINYIYDMYTLIDGVSEFVRTGNAIQLKNIYGEKMSNENNEIAGKIKAVIDSLTGFSNTMSLCTVGNIGDALNNIKRTVEELEIIQQCNDIYEQIFITLIKLIKNKLDFCFDENYSYPKLIKWCVENGMIQQAVTIYIEKMPEYYFRNKIIPEELVASDSVGDGTDTTKYTKAFYTDLYSNCMPVSDEKRIKDAILESAKSIEQERGFEYYRNQIVHGIKKAANESNQSENCRTVLDNIRKVLNKIYPKGKRVEHADSKLPGDIIAMINSINNNGLSVLNEAYKARFQVDIINKTNTGERRTYHNKIAAINNLEQNIDEVGEADKAHIVKIMQYYIAIKIVRNRMNHASEKTEDDDESEAISYLRLKKIYKSDVNIVVMSKDIGCIKKLLLDAVSDDIQSND